MLDVLKELAEEIRAEFFDTNVQIDNYYESLRIDLKGLSKSQVRDWLTMGDNAINNSDEYEIDNIGYWARDNRYEVSFKEIED